MNNITGQNDFIYASTKTVGDQLSGSQRNPNEKKKINKSRKGNKSRRTNKINENKQGQWNETREKRQRQKTINNKTGRDIPKIFA